VQISGLTVGYGDRAVLTGLDLDVPAGEILVVLGASGCGKSTLLRTVVGLLQPESGTVTTDGRPVTGPGSDRALIFQDDALLPWRSARGNVEVPLALRGVPRRERNRIAQDWLERVGLGEHGHRLPGQLSGGMRQRVQLARALAGEPAVLCMDEPFGALDAQTRRAMQELLVATWRASLCTVLFVTHDVDEALAIADRIVVLGSGGAVREFAIASPRASQPDTTLRATILAAIGGADPSRQEVLS